LHKANFILYIFANPFLIILFIRVEINPKHYIVASYVALGATQQNLEQPGIPHPFRGMGLSSCLRGF
jgi:hypothetical protein